MSFVYQNYLSVLVLILLIFTFIVWKEEKKFFSFVERYWFKKRSFISKVSGLLFIIGFSLLVLSLLDLRGPEERIKVKVPSKRTIILIDVSASMLAEDVRPSRLEKAVMLAKHFSRKAVGHQISVVAFSEIQKKIVPFTADIDLIDARLESIKGLKNQYGSSALSSAIQESIQYFKETGDEPKGNILVLTDGEETSDTIELKIPDSIYLGLVGIGTKNGGRIPLDDRTGLRYGYKTYKGKEVVTKLDEGFFKAITDRYKNSRFWTADTYSLPSEEIVEFFNSEFEKGVENQDMVIKPVFMHWLVVPGILLLVLSYLLKMIKVFAIVAIIVIQPTWAEDAKQEKVMPSHVVEGLNLLQKGKLDREQKMGLAYELQKNDFTEESVKLYKEEEKFLNAEQRFNYGTGLLTNKKFGEGFQAYQKLMDDKNLPQELREKISQNSLLFLKQQEQSKKEDQKKKKEDKQKGNEENKPEKNSGEGQSDNQEQNKQDNNKEDGKEDNKDKKDQDQKNKPEPDDKDSKDKEKKDADQKEKPQPPNKLPAKLKQLMSDDRKLQGEMIKRGTEDMNKRKSNTSKDW